MIDGTETRHGECHCGGVRFRVRLGDGLQSACRCNCSYCAMRGAVVVAAALDDLEILAGESLLSRYQFGTHTAQHYFCSRCGIYTHHQRRSDPLQYSVNAACLDGLSPFDFPEVRVNNGQTHALDAVGESYKSLAGMLRYAPADD